MALDWLHSLECPLSYSSMTLQFYKDFCPCTLYWIFFAESKIYIYLTMNPFNQTKSCTWYYHLVYSFLLKFKVVYKITQTKKVKIKTDYESLNANLRIVLLTRVSMNFYHPNASRVGMPF